MRHWKPSGARDCGSNLLLSNPNQEKSEAVMGQTVAANVARLVETMATEVGRKHKQSYHHFIPIPKQKLYRYRAEMATKQVSFSTVNTKLQKGLQNVTN